VLDLLSREAYADAQLHGLRLEAERIALMTGFDVLASLDAIAFAPFDYQVHTAQVVLRRFRGRGLLCDEVGLGKTIEAGLVLKEYMVRQMVRRVLILTPPSLVEQWREELAIKFQLEDLVTSYDPAFRERGEEAWGAYPRVIASLATARRDMHRAAIAAQAYDLVIVDEAHHLRSRSSATWKLVNAVKSRYILLLTATPVQNSLDELYNLITILKPGQLSSPREFKRQFVVHGDPRLPKNRGRLRELLADVMVRHSRSQISVSLPPRRAHTVRLTLGPEERALYDDVSALVRRRFADLGDRGHVQRFTLQTLQREIGSCAAAAQPTLEALARSGSAGGSPAELLALAERAASLTSWTKGAALEKLLLSGALAQGGEKIIVFTHFRATLALLAKRLRALNIDLVTYEGHMSITEKDEAIRQFERQARVLLSTEAAGEGRNLQFCRLMVNVDLPWNPQRIEQRVGRIHRVGQTRPVEVFNLSAEGTVEDFLLDILDRKLNMFELVIGEMGMILGELADERDFEDLVMDLWARAGTADDLSRNFEQLGQQLVQAREAYRRSSDYDQALFGEDLATQ
jgi:SNF2 family DNA or RNA helicase